LHGLGIGIGGIPGQYGVHAAIRVPHADPGVHERDDGACDLDVAAEARTDGDRQVRATLLARAAVVVLLIGAGPRALDPDLPPHVRPLGPHSPHAERDPARAGQAERQRPRPDRERRWHLLLRDLLRPHRRGADEESEQRTHRHRMWLHGVTSMAHEEGMRPPRTTAGRGESHRSNSGTSVGSSGASADRSAPDAATRREAATSADRRPAAPRRQRRPSPPGGPLPRAKGAPMRSPAPQTARAKNNRAPYASLPNTLSAARATRPATRTTAASSYAGPTSSATAACMSTSRTTKLGSDTRSRTTTLPSLSSTTGPHTRTNRPTRGEYHTTTSASDPAL